MPLFQGRGNTHDPQSRAFRTLLAAGYPIREGPVRERDPSPSLRLLGLSRPVATKQAHGKRARTAPENRMPPAPMYVTPTIPQNDPRDGWPGFQLGGGSIGPPTPPKKGLI